MNMESVVKVNGVICNVEGKRFARMYGKKIQIFPKSKKIVENHCLSGKFISKKLHW